MGQCTPEDIISQCPFLQMIDTAGNPHADGSAASGARPRQRQSRHCNPPDTSSSHDNWVSATDRRPVVSKRPLHSLAAAKMSPHIHIGPEPVLAAHARYPSAAGSRCPAGSDSAPHSEQNFSLCALLPRPLRNWKLVKATSQVPSSASQDNTTGQDFKSHGHRVCRLMRCRP